MKKTFVIGASMALGLALVATVAMALGPGFGPGFGPGAGPGFGPGSGPGFGQGFGPGAGPGSGPRFGGPGSEIPPIPNLTAEQSAKIQSLREAFLKDTEPLQKALAQDQIEMRNLWVAQNPDKSAITAKQKEISTLQSQLQEKATNMGLEIRKVFTPEQLAQMPAFNQGAGFGPGFARRGFGPRMMGMMRGPMGRW
jgi:Spy/CpxP family protein refolding chaperone